MDEDLQALEKLAADHPIEAQFVIRDLAKVAPLFDAEATRPQAEQILTHWIETGGELRKGVASAWLSRARAALSDKVSLALADAAPSHAAGAAESVVHVDSTGAASAPGQVHPHVAPRIEPEAHATPRQAAAPSPRIEAESAPAPRMEAPAAPANPAQHAKAMTRAAKWGFRAGLGAAGLAGAAGATQLTDKQRAQRTVAANARWGHRGAAAMAKALENGGLAKALRSAGAR